VSTTGYYIVDGAPEEFGNTCEGTAWGPNLAITTDFHVDGVNPDVAVCGTQADTAIAGVRCCGLPSGERQPCQGDCKLFTYQEAEDECVKLKARLCSKDEVLNAEAAVGDSEAGCGYNHMGIWTKSHCI